MAESGIYEIVNLVNGKRYVGSAVKIDRRWWYHRRDLRSGRHHSRYLQNSWAKYGERSFEFRVIELCAVEDLIVREQHYIDTLRPEYNLAPKAGSCLGVKWTEEQRRKKSETAKRLWSDPEFAERHRTIFKESLARPEVREKRAQAIRGERNPFYGKTHSKDTRATISAKAKARLNTPEGNARMRAAISRPDVIAKKRARMAGNQIWKGRQHSDATKQLLREMFTGRVFSEETRRRMSEGQRRKAPPSAETRAKMSGSRRGIRNGSTDRNIYTLVNSDGRSVSGIQLELRALTGISPAGLTQLLKGQQQSSKGWRLHNEQSFRGLGDQGPRR